MQDLFLSNKLYGLILLVALWFVLNTMMTQVTQAHGSTAPSFRVTHAHVMQFARR